MDPYEILGVRPSAGSEEIELAYKGRRSQYHPDRYVQSDAETRAWATRKMQELSAAYEILSDATARSEWNRRQAPQAGANSSTSAPVFAGPSGRPANPGPARPTSLSSWIREHRLSRWEFDRVHVAPKIPHKKLHGALSSYGEGLRADDVLILIDDTIFGGSKEGVLVTETEIRFKEIFVPPVIVSIRGLHNVAVEGKKIYVAGRKVMQFNIPDSEEVDFAFTAVNEYLEAARVAPPAPVSPGSDEVEDPAELIAAWEAWDLFAPLADGVANAWETKRPADEPILRLCASLLSLARHARVPEQATGVHWSAESRRYLASSAARFEVLLFVLAATVRTVMSELGDGAGGQVIGRIYWHTLIPYLAVREGMLADGELLPLSQAAAESVMRRSTLMQAVQHRQRAHLEALAGNAQGQQFLASLREPIDLQAMADPPRSYLRSYLNQSLPAVDEGRALSPYLQSLMEAVDIQVSNFQIACRHAGR